jgi:hypothetical protein
MVFWALIASAILVFAINSKVPRLFCHLSRRLNVLGGLCADPATCR